MAKSDWEIGWLP